MANKLETIKSVLTTALSGSAVVYHLEKPSGDDQCVVYRMVSNPPVRSMSGNLLNKTRIQVDVWSGSFSVNRALVDLVMGALDLNHSDFVMSWNEEDIPVKDLESGLYRTILDFFVY